MTALKQAIREEAEAIIIAQHEQAAAAAADEPRKPGVLEVHHDGYQRGMRERARSVRREIEAARDAGRIAPTEVTVLSQKLRVAVDMVRRHPAVVERLLAQATQEDAA